MESYSLGYALKLWHKSKTAKNVGKSFDKNLSIALRKYVIPALDTSVNKLSNKAFTEYAGLFSVNRLNNCLTIFDQQAQVAIANGQLSSQTKDIYYSALRRFISWLEQQIWWLESFSNPPTDNDVAPFRIPRPPKPTTKQPEKYKYSLDKSSLPENLAQQLQDYQQFRTTAGKASQQRRQNRQAGRIRRPRIKAIKLSTYKTEEQVILCFLGWYTQTYPDVSLDLSLLTEATLLDDYAHWVTEVRGTNYSTAVHAADTAIAIAKWLSYDKSTRRNWSDVPLVLELQDLRNEYSEIYGQEKKRNSAKKWKHKKLTHEEARQVVQYLQRLCAPNYGRHDKATGKFLSHGRRSTAAIARAWQTYLITKILVYCPIRQEELRNYIVGETLFRKEDEHGQPYYIAKLPEHKRSQLTGQARHYRLPAILTKDIDAWLFTWRPLIVDAVKSLDTWMEFWGCSLGRVERIRQRVEAARQGVVGDKVTSKLEKYLKQEETRLQGAENRIAAWEIAKSNLATHNRLFFMFAKGEAESFGQPHDVASVWSMVSEAISSATQALFDEPRWTNPHALRHIAEKHIRQIGKQKIAHAFGTLIGHSKEMGDEYAKQITSEYEQTLAIVDDWWKPMNGASGN